MTNYHLYHIDAFTNRVFSGNPAAVCMLSACLSDDLLHAIAKENNLPVTAFLVREKDTFHIRWITPEYELDLCGHGTLAAGYVILNYIEPTWQQVNLQSRHELLPITRAGNLIMMNFPTKKIEPCSLQLLVNGLGMLPKEMYQHKTERCFAVYETEDEVRQLQPNMAILKQLEHRGITVTARSNSSDVDFVSRTFYPQKTQCEDPATGASHCLLVPYWASKLNKTEFHAKQVSPRGGEMFCRLEGDRVLIGGEAVMYLQGELFLAEANQLE